jgi:hypothetical protein
MPLAAMYLCDAWEQLFVLSRFPIPVDPLFHGRALGCKLYEFGCESECDMTWWWCIKVGVVGLDGWMARQGMFGTVLEHVGGFKRCSVMFWRGCWLAASYPVLPALVLWRSGVV